jgi:hypothetical protein
MHENESVATKSHPPNWKGGCAQKKRSARRKKKRNPESLDEVGVVRDGSGDQRQIYMLWVRLIG